jgi:hypothetical protein
MRHVLSKQLGPACITPQSGDQEWLLPSHGRAAPGRTAPHQLPVPHWGQHVIAPMVA